MAACERELHVELAVDATDVMLDRLRADEQALPDLDVRVALAEEPQHLDLAAGQEPGRPRPGRRLHTKFAHQRCRFVSLADCAQRLELGERPPCDIDGGLPIRDGEDPREVEAGPGRVQPESKRRVAVQRLTDQRLRIGRVLGGRYPAARKQRRRDDPVTFGSLRDPLEP